MKITLIYKNEGKTLNVPESLSVLHKRNLLSAADVVSECKKAYASQISLATGHMVDVREIKGTLKK
jgi:hypothetical protein